MWNTVLIACLIALPTCDDDLVTFSLTCFFCCPPTFLPSFLPLPTFPSSHCLLSPLSPLISAPLHTTHTVCLFQQNISSITLLVRWRLGQALPSTWPLPSTSWLHCFIHLTREANHWVSHWKLWHIYVIEHHSISFPVMSPHHGLINFCSCSQCRRRFVL